MKFLADFHIHSKYSYATSKMIDVQTLAIWGQLKGLTIMGTGDFTHPVWRKQLYEQLELAESGLFSLRPKFQAVVDAQVYSSCRSLQRFLLTAEVSTIFWRHGKCYKTHTIIFAPSLNIAEKISIKLSSIGNIAYDGRPILSLDVKDLLKIILDISPECMLIPAHIWTPHFGLLGSKSGFDSFEDCFQELTEYIYAFEKGLSSNFLMNAQVSKLDRFAILSNSDAHSLQNLGREANLFDTAVSYEGITQALKVNDGKGLVAGIEFFPEMGKYYGSGHRNCQIYLTNQQVKTNAICPVCHKLVTIGVAYRVDQLSDRSVDQAKNIMKKHYPIVPLQELLAYHCKTAVSSKKVQLMYQHLLSHLGNEFYILLQASVDEIARCSTIQIAQSIFAVRTGKIVLQPGYDGIYGSIKF